MLGKKICFLAAGRCFGAGEVGVKRLGGWWVVVGLDRPYKGGSRRR